MGFFEWVGNAIFGTLVAKAQHLVTKVAKLTLTSTTDPDVPFRKDAADFASYQRQGAEQIMHTEIDQTLARHSPITPEEAADDFPGLFAGALMIMNAFDIASLITEVASLGQVDKAIGYMKNTVAKSTGADKILGIIANLNIKCGSEIPLNYYYLRTHRPMIPPMGDCVEALSRYMISAQTFDDTAKYHGFAGTYLDWYKEFSKTPLKYFALAAIARSGLYDEDFFEDELRRAGYAPESKDKLKDMYKSLAGEMEIAGAKSIAAKAYREGIIERSEYEDYLLRSGLDPTLTTLSLDLADLQKETSARDLSTSVVSKLYSLGIIEETEFRARLAELDYTTEGIDDLVDIANIKREEDPKNLTLGQLSDAIKYDLIDETFYYNKTKDLGYSREYSELLLNTLRAKQTKTPRDDHRPLTYSQIMKMFKQELLSLEDVRARLKLMGYNIEDSDLLIASNLRDMTVPDSDVWKPLPRATVVDLFTLGYIDYSEYIDRMELLRIKHGDADLLYYLELEKGGT